MSQKVLYLTAKFGPFEVQTAPIPKPGPGEVLIRVEATALNPVDWKIQVQGIFIDKFPAILGGDAAGVVEEVGEGVTNLKKGDRVLTNGVIGVNEHATFQQYTLGNADVTGKVPDTLTFDQAASVPLGLATAAVGLFNQGAESGSVGLYPPWEEGGRGKYSGEPIVVFGGASSVGQYAIQVARLAGFSPIITTASPRNAEWLKTLGATHVLDRNHSDDALLAEVRKITSAPVKVIYDAVSLPETQNVAYSVLAPGGSLVIVLSDAVQNKTADKRVIHVFGNTNAPANRKLGVSLYSVITGLLVEGAIKPNHVEVLHNGLHGIITGLEKLEKGVSNLKLVSRPQETA